REDKAEVYRRGKYLYYRPKRHETWIDIAAKFPEVTLEQLLLLNEIDASQPTAPGTKVRIRRF
ncbi:MAG: LysM peptidoglycan-binding domain-containing protein, partial [Saprospiraceae bacterium]|nr:LysM peptidoglycan-binding domain-containing protein [Saprospiraceae bacterium]MCB0682019.1 LysM peptidoglycan-binding domain-containing protein [Saprospiraceae bacterium]